MDRKVRIECTGTINSVLLWNKEVYISIETYQGIAKFKIHRIHWNPKKLYVGDVVKVMGTISEYNNTEEDVIYSATITVGSVHKMLGKNKPVNNKLDGSYDFSFVGTILTASEIDSEFYQIKFQEATEDNDVHTVYVLKEEFEKAIENYDFGRLIHLSGKTSITSNHKFFFEIPVSNIKNYATSIKYI